MLNCIGTMPDRDPVPRSRAPTCTTTARRLARGRKLGHVTVVADNAHSLDERIEAVRAAVDGR